ncbi:hypothetical protein D3C87_1719910 [compost metagenome]
MHDFLSMASSGRVYLFGKGDKKLNPIDGEDLAKVCIEKMEGEEKEYAVGGPDVLSQRQIAELAFKALGKKATISYLPDFLRVLIIKGFRLFTSSRTIGPYEFFLTAMANDNVAPLYGEKHLEDFFNAENR